jgi:hypothetical protein
VTDRISIASHRAPSDVLESIRHGDELTYEYSERMGDDATAKALATAHIRVRIRGMSFRARARGVPFAWPVYCTGHVEPLEAGSRITAALHLHWLLRAGIGVYFAAVGAWIIGAVVYAGLSGFLVALPSALVFAGVGAAIVRSRLARSAAARKWLAAFLEDAA